MLGDVFSQAYIDRIKGTISEGQFEEITKYTRREEERLKEELDKMLELENEALTKEEIIERLKEHIVDFETVEKLIKAIFIGEKNENGEQKIKIYWKIGG